MFTAVLSLTGLARCGKSCRLRWLNYLRPDLKHGNYTREEEEIIIKLHQQLGNKYIINLRAVFDNFIQNSIDILYLFIFVLWIAYFECPWEMNIIRIYIPLLFLYFLFRWVLSKSKWKKYIKQSCTSVFL